MEKKNHSKDERKSRLAFLLVFFILSVAVSVLGIFCLAELKFAFVQTYFTPLSIAFTLFIVGIYAFSVWSALSDRKYIAKSMLSIYILILFLLIVYFVLQKTGFFTVVKTPEKLQAYLEKAGAWMPISYILLQFLQVVILPIPSIVSTVAGVALFGAFWTTVYSLIGILAGSLLAFFIGRKLGYRAVSWAIGEESLQKWRKKLKGKDNLFLTLMFVLPLFPDDILCFLAGLSTMSTCYFIIIITISRIMAISATCYSIDFIPFNTWWGITIWAIFFAAIILAFIIVYKNMDRLQAWFKRKRKK